MSWRSVEAEERRRERLHARHWRAQLYSGTDWDAEWERETLALLVERIVTVVWRYRAAGLPLPLDQFGPEVRRAVRDRQRAKELGSHLLHQILTGLDGAEAECVYQERNPSLRDQVARFLAEAEDSRRISRHIRVPGFEAYVRMHDLLGRPMFVIASIDARKPGTAAEFLRIVQELTPCGELFAEMVHSKRISAALLRLGWQPTDHRGNPVPEDHAWFFLWSRAGRAAWQPHCLSTTSV
jgi:hypothetical protein